MKAKHGRLLARWHSRRNNSLHSWDCKPWDINQRDSGKKSHRDGSIAHSRCVHPVINIVKMAEESETLESLLSELINWRMHSSFFSQMLPDGNYVFMLYLLWLLSLSVFSLSMQTQLRCISTFFRHPRLKSRSLLFMTTSRNWSSYWFRLLLICFDGLLLLKHIA